MENVSLDESQSDIKIAKINIKTQIWNVTTLMAKSEEGQRKNPLEGIEEQNGKLA